MFFHSFESSGLCNCKPEEFYFMIKLALICIADVTLQNGEVVYTETSNHYYWTYEDCQCSSGGGTGRRKRQALPVPNVSECRDVTGTVFTSPVGDRAGLQEYQLRSTALLIDPVFIITARKRRR